MGGFRSAFIKLNPSMIRSALQFLRRGLYTDEGTRHGNNHIATVEAGGMGLRRVPPNWFSVNAPVILDCFLLRVGTKRASVVLVQR